MKPTPSLKLILTHDYITALGWIFPLVWWGASLAVPFLDLPFGSFFGEAAPWVTAVALSVILWCVWQINRLFRDGTAVPGVIAEIGFFRDRGRVDYRYEFQMKKYQSGHAIMATKSTRKLATGQAVTVYVDPFNPKKTCLQELFVRQK